MDKIFNKPFAVNGARVAIPENGSENERVSFDKGFTQPYEVEAPSVDNPNGQGFNILRPEMNEALYQLSLACNVLAENIDKWTLLTTENLNDITQPGRYNQGRSINATASNNYPVNSAGFLIVFLTGAYALTQIYKDWRTDKFYIRRNTSTTQDTNNWSDWDSFVLTSEVNTRTPPTSIAKIGYGYSNFNTATFTIPNSNFLKVCNIMISFRLRQQNNNTITIKFKNGSSVLATKQFERSSVSRQDFDVNDYISGVASFKITDNLLGKTIKPEITATNTGASFLLNSIDLMINFSS